MELLLLFVASTCYAVGGLFMKLSAGASRLVPTLAFAALFLIGALLQALAMRRTDLAVAYIAVLGLEAILIALFSAFFLHEAWPSMRFVAVLLIIAGVVLLRRT
jgi:quaternary ammonium compound-resistance protein SugE